MTDRDSALELALKIETRAAALLAPLEREMKIKKWDSEFRKIMWEAVAMAALKKCAEP